MEGSTNSDLKPCTCGCGALVKGRFKHGHHMRVNNPMKGRLPPNYKGGWRVKNTGYIGIQKNGRELLQHREVYAHYLLIMCDEEITIPRNVHVHHKDGNRRNNALINLEAMYIEDHISMESTGRKHSEETKKKIRETNRITYWSKRI